MHSEPSIFPKWSFGRNALRCVQRAKIHSWHPADWRPLLGSDMISSTGEWFLFNALFRSCGDRFSGCLADLFTPSLVYPKKRCVRCCDDLYLHLLSVLFDSHWSILDYVPLAATPIFFFGFSVPSEISANSSTSCVSLSVELESEVACPVSIFSVSTPTITSLHSNVLNAFPSSKHMESVHPFIAWRVLVILIYWAASLWSD